MLLALGVLLVLLVLTPPRERRVDLRGIQDRSSLGGGGGGGFTGEHLMKGRLLALGEASEFARFGGHGYSLEVCIVIGNAMGRLMWVLGDHQSIAPMHRPRQACVPRSHNAGLP